MRPIAVPIGSEVPEKPKQSPDISPEISERIIQELERRMERGEAGFEGPTAIAALFGVKQPSVTAWFVRRRLSFQNAQKAEEVLGRDFLGRRKDSPETREWWMRWRALTQLEKSGYDVGLAFVAVNSQKFVDRPPEDVGWGDYFDGAKRALDGGGTNVELTGTVPAPGAPSGPAHDTIPPSVKATAKRELSQPRQKSPGVTSRKTSK